MGKRRSVPREHLRAGEKTKVCYSQNGKGVSILCKAGSALGYPQQLFRISHNLFTSA